MSMSRGTKYFGDHLGPLRRFLSSRVGRPWDQIHSEISRALRARGVMQNHVLLHLDHMVFRRVTRIDGELYGHDDGRYVAIRWAPFYVCPKRGVLKRSPGHHRWGST